MFFSNWELAVVKTDRKRERKIIITRFFFWEEKEKGEPWN